MAPVTGAQPSPADVQVTFCATVIDQMVSMGLRHAVVAPGSRSTPMALAIAAEERVTAHVAHDERTAAFIALGVGLETGVPAVLLCTSGTAATHFHGAVVGQLPEHDPYFLGAVAERGERLVHGGTG